MIAQVLLGLILLVPVLRILLPLVRARFSNPICQAIYRTTNPLIVPLNKLLPPWRNLSIPAVLLAWLVCAVSVWVLLALFGSPPGLALTFLLGFGTLIQYILTFYFWAIVLVALMSFFSPDYGNPAVELVMALTRPVLRWFDLIPLRFGNISLSPLWAGLTIRLVKFTLDYLHMPSFPL
jgi:YggT family protein